MKVLIAEDDPITLESVSACLTSEGFTTILATNGEQAIAKWSSEQPDLVCLDIMMPHIDGYEVCRRIRATDPHLPVLFLSAKNEEIDVVVGLEIGADDFVRKPFGKHELLARIRSVLRRSHMSADAHSESPTFTLGPDSSELIIYPTELRAERTSTSESIDLSPREVSILQCLHERAGQAVHRDYLLDQCWGVDYYPESRTLDQHIANLRKSIELDPSAPEIIETVRGVGYRVAKV